MKLLQLARTFWQEIVFIILFFFLIINIFLKSLILGIILSANLGLISPVLSMCLYFMVKMSIIKEGYNYFFLKIFAIFLCVGLIITAISMFKKCLEYDLFGELLND